MIPGDFIQVERLNGKVGEKVSFEEVLFVGDGNKLQVGFPTVGNARVVGTITEQEKGEKILVFKFKRRKMSRKKQGHRQLFTRIQIDGIELASKAKATTKAKPARKKAPQEAKPKSKSGIKGTSQKQVKKQAKPAEKKTALEKKAVKKKTSTTHKKSTGE